MTNGVPIGLLLVAVFAALGWWWARKAEAAAKRAEEHANRVTGELARFNDDHEGGG